MKRIRYRRGQKLPANTKYVGRPSRWGNPWKVTDDYPLGLVLHMYEIWLKTRLRSEPDFLEPLRGYNLSCYCPLDQACHADILLEALK